MSLTAQFSLCSDGQWYKDPIWFGNFHGHAWFICTDDDEPHEIVMAGIYGAPLTKKYAEEILKSLKITFELIGPGDVTSTLGTKCWRYFPQTDFKKEEVASSWYFEWKKTPPVPQRPESPTEASQLYGVLFTYDQPLE